MGEVFPSGFLPLAAGNIRNNGWPTSSAFVGPDARLPAGGAASTSSSPAASGFNALLVP
jgi:hypothetical protein